MRLCSLYNNRGKFSLWMGSFSGSRWGFQGKECFQMPHVPLKAQAKSVRSCRQHSCPWALGAMTIPKKA